MPPRWLGCAGGSADIKGFRVSLNRILQQPRTVWLMPESRPRYSSRATSSDAMVSIHIAASVNPSAATDAAPTGNRRPQLHA